MGRAYRMADERCGIYRCGPWRLVIVGPVFAALGAVIAWQGILGGHMVAVIAGPLIVLYALAALVTGVRELRRRRAETADSIFR